MRYSPPIGDRVFFRGLLMAMLLSTMAIPATVAAGGFSSPGADVRLDAGRRVEVRWDGLPRGIEEMELLLSCDGGHEFVRVADRLDPLAVSHLWLVPSLPTGDAVLAIRGRINGRETVLFQSAPFAIRQTAGLGLQPATYHGDELWTDTAGSPTPVKDVGLADPRPRTSVVPSGAEEPDDGSSGLDRVLPAPSSDAPIGRACCSVPALEPTRSRSPLAFPQRK